jgi:nucleoid-associated protein YgaU
MLVLECLSMAQKSSLDAVLEETILRLLGERGAGKTICPSEAARAVTGSDERAEWDPLMEPSRAAARRLVAQGRLLVTQGGVVVDPSKAKGPIRLRLR